MLQGQAAYGRDPAEVADGGFSLGRNLFSCLPDDAFDAGPHSRGHFHLVADVRLDNRPDLVTRLGMAAANHAWLPDAALLFESLLRWGDDAVDLLVGEFAFAFWDGARQQLLLGRDILGVRPLYYHKGKSFFAFASMPSGLHALDEIPYDFDKQFMVESLAALPRTSSRTEFTEIERVEPAHIVCVTRDRIQSRKYWRPPAPPVSAARPVDYEEGLRNVIDQAVAAQLRGAGDAVASHLSGGLDSSTVTTSAARLLPAGNVIAFTAVPRAGFEGPTPPGTAANEAELAAATARLYPNIEHVLVESSGESLLDLLERDFVYMQQPGSNLNSTWGQAIHREAHSRGLNTVLKGYSGNMTMSYSGLELLPTLLMRGRLLKLARYTLGLASNGVSLKTLVARTLGPCLPPPMWQAMRRLGGKRGRQTYTSQGTHERIDALSRGDSGNYVKSVLAEWGLSVRDPTGDKRVIEFCLATPIEEFVRGGVPRSLARRAFAGRLPREVATWRMRGYQAADWYETLGRARDGIEREIALIAQCEAAAEIVDIESLKDAVNSWPEAGWHKEEVRARYRSGLVGQISVGHFIRKVRDSQ